eukprot:5389736-Pleurochrysis_carterae.AAC.1
MPTPLSVPSLPPTPPPGGLPSAAIKPPPADPPPADPPPGANPPAANPPAANPPAAKPPAGNPPRFAQPAPLFQNLLFGSVVSARPRPPKPVVPTGLRQSAPAEPHPPAADSS